jgi:hypothetical protein
VREPLLKLFSSSPVTKESIDICRKALLLKNIDDNDDNNDNDINNDNNTTNNNDNGDNDNDDNNDNDEKNNSESKSEIGLIHESVFTYIVEHMNDKDFFQNN